VSAALKLKWNLVSVDDYLAAELDAPVKHEYVAGVVYALAGARNAHNTIGGNIFGELHARLRGRTCRPFNSDTKIRVRQPGQVRFYYPDTSVICRPNPPSDTYQDEPTVLFEVLSRRTRRIDLGEKKDSYLTIPSLGVYVIVEQDTPTVIAFRRTGDGLRARGVYGARRGPAAPRDQHGTAAGRNLRGGGIHPRSGRRRCDVNETGWS
jgi:Uma2 family endonuclease